MPHCHLCHVNHQIKYCPFFIGLGPELRRRTLEKTKMCVNCLAHTHTLPDCLSLIRCRYCGSNHHSLLHVHAAGNEGTEDQTETSSAVTKHPYALPKPQPPVQVVPLIRAIVSYKDHEEPLTFMVNPQSRHSWMLQDTASRFPDFQAEYNNVGLPCGRFVVQTYRSNFSWFLRLTPEFESEVPAAIGDIRLRAHFNNFVPLAHENFHDEEKVDVILGGKSWDLIKKPAIIKQDKTLPIAQATMFGWVIHGTWQGCACRRHEAQIPIHLPR